MNKPTFSTIDSKDLQTASGGNAIDVPPSGPRNPWGPIIGRPGGTPPFFPRPPTGPGPTFPFPTGPTSPIGNPWEGMSSDQISAARTRIEQ
jgi:hypothetical protein